METSKDVGSKSRGSEVGLEQEEFLEVHPNNWRHSAQTLKSKGFSRLYQLSVFQSEAQLVISAILVLPGEKDSKMILRTKLSLEGSVTDGQPSKVRLQSLSTIWGVASLLEQEAAFGFGIDFQIETQVAPLGVESVYCDGESPFPMRKDYTWQGMVDEGFTKSGVHAASRSILNV